MLRDSIVKSISSSTLTVDVSGETIMFSSFFYFLHIMYIVYKMFCYFNFVFDFVWTGRGLSVSSVDYYGFVPYNVLRNLGLTFRLLMSYIYGAPILDVSRSHTTTHHSR
jgi:hypothetical protein